MTELQVELILDRVGTTHVLRIILLSACLGYVFDAFDNSLIGYAIPFISKDFRLSDLMNGLILSGGLWGGVLGQIVWGRLADSRGRLFAFRGTLLMFSVFSALTALAFTPLAICVCRLLAGAGLGAFIPIDTAIVSEFSPTKNRGRYTGLIAVLWPVGAMLALATSLLLLPRMNWRWLFVLGLLPAILVWTTRTIIPESPRWLVGQKRPEEAKQSLRQLGVPNNVLQEEMAEAVLPSLHTVLDSRPSTAISSSSQLAKRVFLAWLLWLANLYASMSLIVWLPSILVRVYHHTIVDSLAYTLLITSCGFLGRIVGFYLLDKASRRFSLGYSLLLAAFCMFAISFIRNAHLALALAMLFYFFNEQSSVSQMAYIPELFPTKIRVRGNAWCSASARMVVATSPILIGYLLGNGHFQVIATILSMSLFIPWLVFVIWAPEMRGIGLSEITA